MIIRRQMRRYDHSLSYNMTKKMQKAMAAINAIAASELGDKRKRRYAAPARQDAFADIKAFRREHPECSLREAAIACGRKV